MLPCLISARLRSIAAGEDRMRLHVGRLALCLALIAPAVPVASFAAGLEPTQPAKPRNPDFETGRQMLTQQNYRGAIPHLQKAVQAEPNNADAYNLLGFATRKSGDPRGSLQFYNRALSLDPKHLGAHEYIGEAYLMLGDVKKAEEHLARLDQLCLFGCREHRTLRDAVNAYKQGRRPGA
jgi:tetratricopeptide (TPR) repeat protein